MRTHVVAVAAVLAGCHVQVHPAPIGNATSVLTVPTITEGEIHVATSGDDVYAVTCAAGAQVSRIVDRKIAWTRELPGRCYSYGVQDKTVAASASGVVVATLSDGRFSSTAVTAFAPDGNPRWSYAAAGAVTSVALATSARGTALGYARGALGSIIELDAAGTQVGVHTIDLSGANERFSYDRDGRLWLLQSKVAIPNYEERRYHVEIDGHKRSLVGTWAFEPGGAQRELDLGDRGRVMPVAAGFVVIALGAPRVEAAGANFTFDYTISLRRSDGSTAWQLDMPSRGCGVDLTVLDATETSLRLETRAACTKPLTSPLFPVERRSGPLKGAFIVDVAMPAGVVDSITELDPLRALEPWGERLELRPLAHGIVAFGEFYGPLGYGSQITTPLEQKCIGDPPPRLYDPSYQLSLARFEVQSDDCPRGQHKQKLFRGWPVIVWFDG